MPRGSAWDDAPLARVTERPSAPPASTLLLQGEDRDISFGAQQVELWLAANDLDQYGSQLRNAGYNRMTFLGGMIDAELEAVITELKMPRPHARVFRGAIWRLRTAASGDVSTAANTASIQSGGGSAPLVAVPVVVQAELAQALLPPPEAAASPHAFAPAPAAAFARERAPPRPEEDSPSAHAPGARTTAAVDRAAREAREEELRLRGLRSSRKRSALQKLEKKQSKNCMFCIMCAVWLGLLIWSVVDFTSNMMCEPDFCSGCSAFCWSKSNDTYCSNPHDDSVLCGLPANAREGGPFQNSDPGGPGWAPLCCEDAANGGSDCNTPECSFNCGGPGCSCCAHKSCGECCSKKKPNQGTCAWYALAVNYTILWLWPCPLIYALNL
jgi:hypothetical protein